MVYSSDKNTIINEENIFLDSSSFLENGNILVRGKVQPQHKYLLDIFPGILSLFNQIEINPSLNSDESASQTIGLFNSATTGIAIITANNGKFLYTNPSFCSLFGYTNSDMDGESLDKIFHPVSQEVLTEFIYPSEEDDTFSVLTVCIRKDGSLFHSEIFGFSTTIEQYPYSIFFAREFKNNGEAEKLILNWNLERFQEQETLNKISSAISSNPETDPDLILAQLQKILPYTHSLFLVVDNDTLISMVTREMSHSPIKIQLSDTNTLRMAFRDNQPVLFGSTNGDSCEFFKSIRTELNPEYISKLQSWLWIPLVVDKKYLGFIGVAHPKKGFFKFHHARLASCLSPQISNHMNNSEIYKQEQKVGAMQERQVLAHNLHDTVNQSLFSAGLIAEVLPHLWESNPIEGQRSLSDIYRLIRSAQAEIRTMLVDLRPTPLFDVEFCDLINLLAKAFMGRTNIPINVVIDGTCTLPTKVQTAAYQICQEALNNIVKHSKAKTAEIFIHMVNGGIDLEIRDDGCGFDRRREGTIREENPFEISNRDNTHGFNPKYIPLGHYGLRIMNEQANNIGGLLKINSQPGHGCQISLQWRGDPDTEVQYG